jgi:hypothetical protein
MLISEIGFMPTIQGNILMTFQLIPFGKVKNICAKCIV